MDFAEYQKIKKAWFATDDKDADAVNDLMCDMCSLVETMLDLPVGN